MHARIPLVGLVLALVAACSDSDVPADRVGASRSGIINGTVDDTHHAVVAAFGNQSGCTATIIHVDGNVAYALSAAHCFAFDPMQAVAIGTDYEFPDAVLNVIDYRVHPNYSSQSQSFDFAVMTLSGADPSTPVIPALRPALDTIATGTPVEHVGYGLTSVPNGYTTRRHHSFGTINQDILSQIGLPQQYYVGYLQSGSGPCSGDSGGPNLVDTPNGQRVGGVTSFGDQDCAQFGVSGRVSSVYDSFIGPYIGNPPEPEPTTAASSSSASVGAGGAATGPTTGAGGDSWVAGDFHARDLDGDVVSSCATSPGKSSASVRWLVAVLLTAAALGSARRRR